jgi:CHAT domain-containing protein
MKGFYKNIFKNFNYDEALRQSKLNMIKKSKIAAMPSNWAGVLILGQ